MASTEGYINGNYISSTYRCRVWWGQTQSDSTHSTIQLQYIYDYPGNSGYTAGAWVYGGPFSVTLTMTKGTCTLQKKSSYTWNITSSRLNGSAVGNTWYTFDSGTTLWPNSNGEIEFKISFTCKELYAFGSAGTCSGSGTFSLASKMTAPTNVTTFTPSIGSSIIIPGNEEKDITLSWSGAKGGTNNAIASYSVYYRYGAEPEEPRGSWDGWYNTGSASVSSHVFNIPQSELAAHRGERIYFGIITCGANSNTGMKSVQGPVVNTVPSAPSTSSTGSTKITFSKTSDNTSSYSTSVSYNYTTHADTSQSILLKYSSSSDGTKTTIDSGSSFTVSGEGSSSRTYYFWFYDGLEYSSMTSQTFSFGITPDISGNVSATIDTYTVGQNVTSNRGIKSLKITTNTYGTLTTTLYHSTSRTGSFSSIKVEERTLNNAVTNYSLPDINVDGLLFNASASYRNADRYWYLKFSLESPAGTSTTYLYNGSSSERKIIKALPGTPDKYNKAPSGSAYNDYTNSISGHMSKIACIVFSKDTNLMLRSGDITCTAGGTTQSLKSASLNNQTWGNQDKMYVLVELSSTPPSGVTINFSIKLSSIANNSYKTYTVSYTGVKRPTNNSLGTISSTNTTINMFDSNLSGTSYFNFSFPKLPGNSLDAILSDYECAPYTDGSLQFRLMNKDRNEATGKTINFVEKPVVSSTSDYITGKVKIFDIFNFDNASQNFFGMQGVTGYWGTYSCYYLIKMQNAYGDVFTTTLPSSPQFNLNFNRDISVSRISKITYDYDGVSSGNLSGTFYEGNSGSTTNKVLKEMSFYFTCYVETYTYETVEVAIMYKKNGESSYLYANEFTSISGLNCGSATGSGDTRHIIPGTNSVYISIPVVIPEITSNTNWTWRPRFRVRRNNAYIIYDGATLTTGAEKQVSPSVTLSSNISNKTLNNSYKITNHGIDNSNNITYNLIDLNNYSASTGYHIFFSALDKSLNTSYNKSIDISDYGQNMILVAIEASSKVPVLGSSTNFHIEKYYITAPLVFSEAPLIAYRKNTLGINTAHPENIEGATVVIQQASGKDKIAILGTRTGSGTSLQNVLLTIDIPNGKLSWQSKGVNDDSYQDTHKYIDFINGEIHGFVLK